MADRVVAGGRKNWQDFEDVDAGTWVRVTGTHLVVLDAAHRRPAELPEEHPLEAIEAVRDYRLPNRRVGVAAIIRGAKSSPGFEFANEDLADRFGTVLRTAVANVRRYRTFHPAAPGDGEENIGLGIEYGDKVEIVRGEHAGEIGWVTGLDKSDPYAPTLGVERDSGSVIRVPWSPGLCPGEQWVSRVEDPYALGVAAYLDSAEATANPYDEGDWRHAEWSEGWGDSAADDETAGRTH